MQNIQKITSYIGFAARANKIIYGIDRVVIKNKVPLIIMGANAQTNTTKKIMSYADKTKSPLVILENGVTLEDILKKNNCKVIAILDCSLAKAIIDNAISGGM